MTSFTELSPEKRYEIIMMRIHHEHELTNSRMKWLLTFQGFLFATMAVSSGNLESATRDIQQNWLPVIGLTSGAAVLLGVVGSRLARGRLHGLLKHPDLKDYPSLRTSLGVSLLGMAPSFLIPTTLLILWTAFLVR